MVVLVSRKASNIFILFLLNGYRRYSWFFFILKNRPFANVERGIILIHYFPDISVPDI